MALTLFANNREIARPVATALDTAVSGYAARNFTPSYLQGSNVRSLDRARQMQQVNVTQGQGPGRPASAIITTEFFLLRGPELNYGRYRNYIEQLRKLEKQGAVSSKYANQHQLEAMDHLIKRGPALTPDLQQVLSNELELMSQKQHLGEAQNTFVAGLQKQLSAGKSMAPKPGCH